MGVNSAVESMYIVGMLFCEQYVLIFAVVCASIATVDPATLASYYEDADLYVQTSNMECLPLALLTAMAHGIPIITTDVDGCKEAIVDGECGLTVPPRHPSRLADAMRELLGDPIKSRQFGKAARLRFEAVFSLEKNLERMFETIGPPDRASYPKR